MMSQIDGAVYVERVTVNNIPNLNKAKKAIKKAFELQMKNAGFTFIEVVSTCPTNWGKTPVESFKWLEENMLPVFPLGVYKDVEEVASK